MSYTSPPRPGEAPVPAYRWVPSQPDPKRYGSTGGCHGCAFSKQHEVRCSRIPCHVGPYRRMVAELVEVSA